MAKKKATPEFKQWNRRKWLNSATYGGTAFIEMDISEICKEYSHAGMDGTLKIGDCSRIVALEFWVSDDEKVGAEHSMKKIDVLITALGQFKVKMREAIDAARKSRADAAVAEEQEDKARNARG